MAEWDSEEKKDEEEGQKEGGAPVSRQSFNEEPLKLGVIEALPYPQKEERDQHLSKDRLSFPFSSRSHHIFSLLIFFL